MDKGADFFQKKLSNTRSFARQKKGSHVWIRIIIVLVILLVLGLLYWKIFWAPTKLDGYGEDRGNDTAFSLGKEIFLQGEIKADGDIITHTHTIEDINYGKIGIKSDSLNLSDYVGFVQLTGIVEKFYQGNPIVKVTTLSGNVSDVDDETNIVLDGNVGVYLKGAGIQLLPSFFDEYILLNEGENGEIRIQNIESGKEFTLNYFRCNASDPNRNCKGLTETFANNNAQSFITSEGDVYYKQSEVQSWFVANGDRWGIFIDDVSDDVVYELKDLMKFANEKNMSEWIKSRAMKLCQGSGEKLQNISSSEISLKQEGLVVSVSGDGLEKQMTCQILVDFSLPTKGELKSLVLGDDVVIDENQEEDNEEDKIEESDENLEGEEEKQEVIVSSDFVLDKSVEQFPIKEEGGLVYNSTRGGYSLQFPSSNISYAVSSVKETFGRSDVSCSYVVNVIKYSERENLEISPSIRIYECLGTVTESWAPEILVYRKIDKVFIAQLSDSSWWNFANNLKFSVSE